jgi:hypothetical protein
MVEKPERVVLVKPYQRQLGFHAQYIVPAFQGAADFIAGFHNVHKGKFSETLYLNMPFGAVYSPYGILIEAHPVIQISQLYPRFFVCSDTHGHIHAFAQFAHLTDEYFAIEVGIGNLKYLSVNIFAVLHGKVIEQQRFELLYQTFGFGLSRLHFVAVYKYPYQQNEQAEYAQNNGYNQHPYQRA